MESETERDRETLGIDSVLTMPWMPQLMVDTTFSFSRYGGMLSCTCLVHSEIKRRAR